MISFLNTYLLSIIGVAALTVLTALGDVTSGVTIPLIVGLVGVHAGANLSSPTVVTAPAPTPVVVTPTPVPVVTPTTPTA